MTDSMVSEDSPDFFRVPGIKVRSPRVRKTNVSIGIDGNPIPEDIASDPRFGNRPSKDAQAGRAKNQARFLSSTMTSLVQQKPLPPGEERVHGVIFPNKMTHEQALVIDKFGDGLKKIELQERTGTALDGSIHSLQDMTGGRKQKKYDGSSTMSTTSNGYE